MSAAVRDPFDPGNPLCFAPGPLTGILAPLAGKTVVSSLSPDWYRGNDGKSCVSGHTIMEDTFGAVIKVAGFDQLVVTGRSEKPVYLHINDDRIKFLDASHLWGLGVRETTAKILSENGDPALKVAVIGPAGENRVTFATLVSSARPIGGRVGAGAVMGSKNLKAIALKGSTPVPVADPTGLADSYWTFNEAWCLPNPDLMAHIDRSVACNRKDGSEALWAKSVQFLPLRRIACWSCQISCRQLALGDGARAGFSCTIPEIVHYLRTYASGEELTPADVTTLFGVCADLGLDGVVAGILLRHQRPAVVEWRREALAQFLVGIARKIGVGDRLAAGAPGLDLNRLAAGEDIFDDPCQEGEPGTGSRRNPLETALVILDMLGGCRQALCFWDGEDVWNKGFSRIFEQATGLVLEAAEVKEICGRILQIERVGVEHGRGGEGPK